MAQYLVLIYENEESWANVDEATTVESTRTQRLREEARRVAARR